MHTRFDVVVGPTAWKVLVILQMVRLLHWRSLEGVNASDSYCVGLQLEALRHWLLEDGVATTLAYCIPGVHTVREEQ